MSLTPDLNEEGVGCGSPEWGPWVGFPSTEGWGLELEISELYKAYGNDNCISEKANNLSKVTHYKVGQEKDQKKIGLVSSRALLFLSESPYELCLTEDFTPKEARSFSDPLIPPPCTSSTVSAAWRSTSPSPRIMGLFLQPPAG